MNEKETFDLLLSLVKAKDGSYTSLPPSMQLLLIEKFYCKTNILEEGFPVVSSQGIRFSDQEFQEGEFV